VKLRHALATLMVLGSGIGLLDACSGAGGQEIQKVDAAVMRGLNAYCDGRAKLLDSLGEAGAAQ
jgi:hypothetical protein